MVHGCIFIYEFGATLLVTISFLASILHLGINLSHQLLCSNSSFSSVTSFLFQLHFDYGVIVSSTAFSFFL
uniref:Putative ovule protein n=1 Tax=Solanum chacoense TaxID=4108 RepID=A0A0V0HDG4_SOLCH